MSEEMYKERIRELETQNIKQNQEINRLKHENIKLQEVKKLHDQQIINFLNKKLNDKTH